MPLVGSQGRRVSRVSTAFCGNESILSVHVELLVVYAQHINVVHILPITQIPYGFACVKNEPPNTSKIRLFIKFMKRAWLKCKECEPITLWNVGNPD